MRRSPTLSTSGNGFFKASINRGQSEIRYTLSYRGPFDANAAGGTVTQAHIHLGARARQRRHLGVPVQQPRQRPGGHAGVPAPRAR